MMGMLSPLKKESVTALLVLTVGGIVAEFWQHTDADSPSNEDDIVRLQDDYARE